MKLSLGLAGALGWGKGPPLLTRCPSAWPRMCHQPDPTGVSLQPKCGPCPCSDRTPPWAPGEGRGEEGEAGGQQGGHPGAHPASLPATGVGSPAPLPLAQELGHWALGAGQDIPLPSGALPLGGRTLAPAAFRATRGLLHCLKTLTNSCLLGAQPGWGQRGGSL